MKTVHIIKIMAIHVQNASSLKDIFLVVTLFSLSKVIIISVWAYKIQTKMHHGNIKERYPFGFIPRMLCINCKQMHMVIQNKNINRTKTFSKFSFTLIVSTLHVYILIIIKNHILLLQFSHAWSLL